MKSNLIPLCLSYEALVAAVKDGSVAEPDLARALYFLDCSRESFFDRTPWIEEVLVKHFPKDPQTATAVHDMIARAVRTAETDMTPRVMWVAKETGRQRYAFLKAMLDNLELRGMRSTIQRKFQYELVVDMVDAAGIPIHVIGLKKQT